MSEVVLHVYDLSMGMARMLSLGILGKQIEGIWHTGIVVFGQEYFYGGGICIERPSGTPYGTPVQKVNMGTTNRTPEEFNQFLKSVSHRFTMEAYHLLHHNCNNFTDECCRFLVGKGIPSNITGLPAEVLQTPIGKSFEPLINSMMQVKTEFFQENFTHQEFITHEDIFPENFKKIESYPDHDRFVNQESLILYWNPKDDSFLNILPTICETAEGLEVGCVDCLRYPYLGTESQPFFRVYVEGEPLYEGLSIKEAIEQHQVLKSALQDSME